jgi:hypothetical protein
MAARIVSRRRKPVEILTATRSKTPAPARTQRRAAAFDAKQVHLNTIDHAATPQLRFSAWPDRKIMRTNRPIGEYIAEG